MTHSLVNIDVHTSCKYVKCAVIDQSILTDVMARKFVNDDVIQNVDPCGNLLSVRDVSTAFGISIKLFYFYTHFCSSGRRILQTFVFNVQIKYLQVIPEENERS